MEVNFLAALKQTGSPIKISADCDSTLTLVVPSSEIAEVVKLTMAQAKSLNVRIVFDE